MKTDKKISLFNKHSNVKSSPIYIVYLILRQNFKDKRRLRDDKKIEIYKIYNQMKKIDSRIPTKQVYFAILLMYSLGLVDYQRPYLIIKKND